STLIARISAARPKIADYPFTTLVPNLGVVRRGEDEVVVADIPGLIEGASDGKGLGHQFLPHIERARVLVLLLDLAETAPASPEDQEQVLLRELEQHQPDLIERPRIVVGSRADIAAGPIGWDGAELSAVTGAGVDDLVGKMLEAGHRASAAEPPAAGVVL